MYNKFMRTALFVRSCYSLLGSLLSPQKIAQTAVEKGYQAVALVDEGYLIAAKEFAQACQKYNVKALYGLSFSLRIQQRVYHPFFLARNDEGFRRLMKLSTAICLSQKELDLTALAPYREGNFLIFHSDDNPLLPHLEKEEDLAVAYQKMEAEVGDFIISISDNDIAFNERNNRRLVAFLHAQEISFVCTSRTYYAQAEDCEAFQILQGIKEKRSLDDPELRLQQHRHFLDSDELERLYDASGLRYGDYLASLCNVKLAFHTSLPAFPVPQQANSEDYLRALCAVGLKKRLHGHFNPYYNARLQQELRVIIEMGFTDYFLIVYDYICFAKKQGILVGPGRGSAAGSLVAYCLGIVDVDPVKFGLIFERFLNPERVTMPDIDVDFPNDRRDEVIRYVADKYGKEHVAHILTLGTLKAKQVLRDVGKVMNIPLHDIESLTKMIPSAPGIHLQYCYEKIPFFAQRVESSSTLRRLYHFGLALEFLPRDLSTHAAGIVMSKENLSDVIPLVELGDDLWSVQYTANYLEAMGLIKMDFLGLKNLSIIAEIVEDIRSTNKSLHLTLLPLNDNKVFQALSEGDTLGIFQLESEGMTKLARRMKPRSFEEIAMMIALFRPGPMENIDLFLHNREHPQTIHYLHDDLQPILKETYGIIVYQEQIMTIARKMAGFSYGKADILRHAMSKKKAKELSTLQNEFIEGCVQNHYPRKLAEELYDLVMRFADYGFNKSHSVAYSLIAYQMAFLKVNYPLSFYKALLTGALGAEGKTYAYLHEIRRQKIRILPPDIVLSGNRYTIEKDAIRMPLSLVKNVGSASVLALMEEREKQPLPAEIASCLQRLKSLKIPRDALENLIRAGAFDRYDINRSTLLHKANLDALLLFSEVASPSLLHGHFDLTPDLLSLSETKADIARYELQAFGFYFSVNPFLEIKEKHHLSCPTLSELQQRRGYQQGFARIERIRRHKTKRGDWMAFMNVSDGENSFDIVVMPNLWRMFQDKLEKGRYILFEGMIEKENSCLLRKVTVVE